MKKLIEAVEILRLIKNPFVKEVDKL